MDGVLRGVGGGVGALLNIKDSNTAGRSREAHLVGHARGGLDD